MRTFGSKKLRLIIMLLVAGTVGACGNVSQNISADGRSAGHMAWPAPKNVTPTHKGGTFPEVSQLRLIQPGMTKNQIIRLLGPPHFSEGMVGVREWNYLFKFRITNSDDVTECQYKVLFDEHKLARSFYWRPAGCADALNSPKDAGAGAVPVAQAQTFALSTDALFAFDKSALADIKPIGKAALDSLVRKVAAASATVGSIVVSGYTDRLGTDAYNATLSQQRADTITRYLESHGVATNSITAIGRGASDPIKQCAEGNRTMVIDCLAPNRRVEVTVSSK